MNATTVVERHPKNPKRMKLVTTIQPNSPQEANMLEKVANKNKRRDLPSSLSYQDGQLVIETHIT
jgi:hypothetical protein